MSLLDEDAEPTLQVSPGALLSEEPGVKESKKERRKGGTLSLGRTKPRDPGTTEKSSKKGKHARNKSGSRTPPDSPRADRVARGGRNQPSPNVKSHRKRYSQLGLDFSAEESEDEEEEEQTYFTNQAASEATEHSSQQEPLFSIVEKENVTDQPSSPGPRSTVQFPVQFGDIGSALFPSAAFEPKPTPPQPTVDGTAQSSTKPPFPPAPPQSEVGPWGTALPDISSETVQEEVESKKIPEAEWRISTELRLKCCKQFVELQPTRGLLQGNQARAFFIQSHLPNADLSSIWRLADMDQDNALSEQEFCVAMKLVLLRRKGYHLPLSLPNTLKESIAADSQSSGRNVAPLQTSQTVAELPLTQQYGHPALSDISQHSQPELHQPSPLLVDLTEASPTSSLKASDSLTAVEREEPAVATIISLAGEEEHKPLYHSFTENVTEPSSSSAHTSVRRARSLKHFTPPPPPAATEGSPPHSPFSPSTSSETEPIVSVQNPTPKANIRTSKDKAGYHVLPPTADDEESAEEDFEAEQVAIGQDRGHGRSTSLDLKKMIAGSDVLIDMPAAEPPRPPPKPVTEDSDLLPQVRGRSASTGSISSTGPSVPPPIAMDTSTSAFLLSGTSRPVPARKAPLLPPVPKPRRPPPPRREDKPDNSSSLLRNKSELQTTIRSLKDTNATLQALNRELEEKLFGLMEDRVQLAREVELSRQMQMST